MIPLNFDVHCWQRYIPNKTWYRSFQHCAICWCSLKLPFNDIMLVNALQNLTLSFSEHYKAQTLLLTKGVKSKRTMMIKKTEPVLGTLVLLPDSYSHGCLPWWEAEHSPHVAGVNTALLALDVPGDVLLPPEVADVPSLAPSQGGQQGAEDVPDHGGGVF